MKKYILITILVIIGIISCCQTTIGETIIDLGTINNPGSKQINLDSTEQLNLVYISSEWNQDDLSVTNYGFDPILNRTRFLFISELITPEYWMEPTTVSYIYQETVTKQLYRINVDYSALIIPLSPLEQKLTELVDEYNLTDENDSDIVKLIQDFINNLDDELSSSKINLADKIKQLETLTMNYWNLSGNYNISQSEKNNITQIFDEMKNNYENLKDDNKQNFTNWINSSVIAEKYKGFFNDITADYFDAFWFNEQKYTTKGGYLKQMDKLRWDIEIGNAITVCAVIITAFICFIIIRIKLKRRNQTIEELEDTSGYNEKIDEIDTFINKSEKLTTRIKNKIPFVGKKSIENKPAVNQNPSAVTDLESKIDQLVISMGTMKTDITKDLKKYVDQKTKNTG